MFASMYSVLKLSGTVSAVSGLANEADNDEAAEQLSALLTSVYFLSIGLLPAQCLCTFIRALKHLTGASGIFVIQVWLLDF